MILAVLQARMSSTRLPGKVMLPIMGRPVLELQIERIMRSKLISKLVVATSSNHDDNCIEMLCNQLKVDCFRGDLFDVLGRYYNASKVYSPNHVVRLTGDCPVIDPKIIDDVIELHMAANYQYTSNIIELTFPDGLDTEIFKFSELKKAFYKATTQYDREHVTPWIRQHAGNNMGVYKSDCDYSHYRWTLDHIEDYTLIKKIYEALYVSNPTFDYQDILALMKRHIELTELNTMHIT